MSKFAPKQLAAIDIVEEMLRATADAILAEDFEAMDACFRIPFIVETQDAKIVVDSSAKHRELFDRLVEGYKSKGVTDIFRVCEATEYLSPTVIRSLHTSHLMAGHQRVEEPISTLARTELFADGWRIVSAQYVADKTAPVGRAIDIQSGKAK